MTITISEDEEFSSITDYPPVRIPYPGHRSKQIAKASLVSVLIFLTVVGSVGPWLPGIIRAFTDSSLTEQLPATCSPSTSSPTSTQTNPSNPCAPDGPKSNTPNFAGAGPVPDLSLPKTVLSSVDSLIGAGGVVQSSPQNLTLHNSAIALRLLGGPVPHDEQELSQAPPLASL